ncbi:bifunctional riboflavin kinase/FAD synthetase [Desulfocurvus vexinensis]|uniref:bifunctional riboflavin kinase/FAD synthetase n=1 Tax=Desulfocurvus vexinensis TaxID=399548 RepID=UPI00048B622A|nr:bifunctional riboflavin kinase/FAD synthetase [Desulfocurvus vexinensis]
MIVVRDLEELRDTLRGSCLTIGNFDGVHKGHQKLLARTRIRAEANGHESVAVTFDPHPLRVLTGGSTPPFITLTEQKVELIERQGVDICVLLRFTREMAALEPEEFVRRYLVDGLNMKYMVIGYDYAFGKGRRGNYELLAALGAQHGFQVERVNPYMYGGAVVSSTRIRDMVRAGRVWEAQPLLGRFYTVRGTVEHGQGRGGRLLGFPTANLRLVDELYPAGGVYACWATHKLVTRPAVVNIGTNPTFGEHALSVEVHILDFDRDIYGDDLRVQFVQRLRSERKFNGPQELVTQITRDCELARTILASSQAQP